jgi:hypothetical protein
VAAVRDEVLAKVPDPALRAYVVWTRILDDDDLAAARSAGAALADARLVQLWDGGAELARSLGNALRIRAREREDGMHGLAWDVYLLYERGARWGDAPPPPALWMEQLRQVTPQQAPKLDAPALRARVEAALR